MSAGAVWVGDRLICSRRNDLDPEMDRTCKREKVHARRAGGGWGELGWGVGRTAVPETTPGRGLSGSRPLCQSAAPRTQTQHSGTSTSSRAAGPAVPGRRSRWDPSWPAHVIRLIKIRIKDQKLLEMTGMRRESADVQHSAWHENSAHPRASRGGTAVQQGEGAAESN